MLRLRDPSDANQPPISWEIDIPENEKLPVPSFVRLFIINRVLTTNGNYNITTKNNINDKISDLVSVIQDKEKQEQAQAILLQLITGGIKNYMAKSFNEKTQARSIELIFNQVILTKLGPEYHQVASYKTIETSNEKNTNNKKDTGCNNNKNKNNNNKGENVSNRFYHQEMVFNSKDLMCLIFQHLEYGENWTGTLVNCNFVCTHWFYHAWNPNCIYFLNLTKLIVNTMSCSAGDENSITRVWQRIINVKWIDFGLSSDIKPKSISNHGNLIVDKICKLGNVERIEGWCNQNVQYHMLLLKAIIKKNTYKITRYEVEIFCYNRLKSLKLPNARFIRITTSYYHILWTNKCESLTLYCLNDVDETWLNCVINDCDCSGIKLLYFDWISFSLYTNINQSHSYHTDEFGQLSLTSPKIQSDDDKKKTQLLLTKFAQQFKNLERFQIGFYDDCDSCVLLFWRLLQPIIIKNNISIELEISKHMTQDAHDRLYKLIKDMNATIQKLDIDVGLKKTTHNYIQGDIGSIERFDNFVKLIGNKSLEWLIIRTHESQCASFETMITLLINDNKTNLQKNVIMNIKNENENQNDTTDHNNNSSNKPDNHDTSDVQSKNLILDLVSLSRIEFINYCESSPSLLDYLDQLFSWNMIEKRALFVVVNCLIVSDNDEFKKDKFVASFESLCKSVYSLLIRKRIPIDIKISFSGMTSQATFNKSVNKFNMHLDKEKLFTKYQAPKWNKSCQSLKDPLVSFSHESHNDQDRIGSTVLRGKAVFHVQSGQRNS